MIRHVMSKNCQFFTLSAGSCRFLKTDILLKTGFFGRLFLSLRACAHRRETQDLLRLTDHGFCEDAVTFCRIIDKYVGHRAHKLSVLEDRRTAHECVK